MGSPSNLMAACVLGQVCDWVACRVAGFVTVVGFRVQNHALGCLYGGM